MKTLLKRAIPTRHTAEAGQSIVIIALVMVLLLGIAGLAIDGGGLLLLRRDAQNAVDSAVVAAAYARCTNGNVEEAARTAAKDNGFVNDSITTVNVNTPPLQGPKAGDTNFVEVSITREKPKFFIQVVYGGKLEVTARGVGYCKPGTEMFAGGAIFAGSEDCQDGVNLGGSSVYIEGNVHSNGDLKSTGSDHNIYGSGTAAGGIQGSATFYPNPAQGGVPPKKNIPLLYNVADFAPGGKFAQEATAVGSYHAFSGDIDLPGALANPVGGLIYVDGDVDLNKLEVDQAKGITIVATGEIKFTNQVKSQVIDAYLSNGLLFFSMYEATNCGTTGGISISGSNHRLYGLLYAPHGPISISGSDVRIEGALIADTVGNSASDTVIIHDPTVIPPTPPEIVVAE